MLFEYTPLQALKHLKYRIACYEKRILKEKSPFKKKEYEDIVVWYFERGLGIISLCKNIEKQKELMEYFSTKDKANPETSYAKHKINKHIKT